MSVALRVASRLGLFSRTFLLLTVLMTASLAAWLQAFRSMEVEPRAQQVAQQIVTVVNITRAALVHSAPRERRYLLLDLATNEGIQVYPRESGDNTVPIPNRQVLQRVEEQVVDRLGPETIVAWEVNRIPGLWVSFSIDDDAYWMVVERDRAERVPGVEWLGWGAAALLLSLLGAAVIVGFVNRPLSRLSRATQALSRGETPSPLPESGPEEIRRVNTSFNRMVEELDRAEADRALMLAGISHDLRTPLARLRLEIEMSGASEASRNAIDEDVEQINRTIGQFMEYARPASSTDSTHNVSELVSDLIERERSHTEALGGSLSAEVKPDLWARIAAPDLQRAVGNLIENARRYGHGPDVPLRIDVSVKPQGANVVIEVADRGPGIKAEDVPRLLRPFTRGSDARTDAGGAGLGLAIVRRLLQRAGGTLTLVPRDGGGLVARIVLAASSVRSPDGK
ncbi:two-component sensor histidine kinase [Pigmentiphaga litoralis]|jgi:two-component system osmolarity sensor histidine kinase EnvZ|uniref:sensor histidine kinase n=1 Tax=Pigmentiphaga litoralis TaxID=516702 RepID=UPI001679FED8|nr:sensor histidine kinase [Pigmentiphaga litoralis]GGX02264.1 two-component sensor histidine kinase [Pigmentiphaga litoralis]